MGNSVCLDFLLVADTSPQVDLSGGYGWALLRMIGALLLVCVLAYLVLLWVRRYLMRARDRGGRIRIVDRCALSARHCLWLVEVSGRCLLLGSADGPSGSVTRLAELDPDTLRDGHGPPPAPPPGDP
jgi:flagellar biogenesis protein FliO